MDESVRNEIRNDPAQGDLYEHVIIELYKAVLATGGVGVDGGANTGWHTFGMADASPAVRVYGYEPAPPLFKILEQRCEKYRGRVKVFQKALSNTVGVATFNYFHEPDPEHPQHPLWNAGLSGLKSQPALLAKKAHQVLTVATTRLDDEFDENRLDFFKIDVEGAEFNVLQGASNTIRTHLPLIAFEDGGAYHAALYGYAIQDMYALLTDSGYDVFDILGKPYDADNWVSRAGWRPYYTVALPREKIGVNFLSNAVDIAFQRKLRSR